MCPCYAWALVWNEVAHWANCSSWRSWRDRVVSFVLGACARVDPAWEIALWRRRPLWRGPRHFRAILFRDRVCCRILVEVFRRKMAWFQLEIRIDKHRETTYIFLNYKSLYHTSCVTVPLKYHYRTQGVIFFKRVRERDCNTIRMVMGCKKQLLERIFIAFLIFND